MKSRRQFGWILTALLFVAISAGSVLAQDQPNGPPQASPSVQNDEGPGANSGPAQNEQDPPGRVARVQYMSGEVSMQPGGVNDWVAASLNRPLTTADRIWTDKNSRAELNVGDGFLRMNSETSLTLTNIGTNAVQLELDQGTLEVTVRHLEGGEIYEVDTPNYAFTVMKPGVYRFDVYPNEDQSWVTVRSGYGEATGKGPAVRVNSGQQVRFRADQSLQHTAEAAPARDGFEDWAQVRDKRLDSSVSARYVSPGVIGYQDLDGYGYWQTSPVYGAVWVPYSVPAGWAPYRFGHWAWIAPWGWTWVDDAAWGFAPFHYGRWVAWGGGWGWAPGPVGYWNPYYAPALVGWIGGAGFGVGFGWGGGWGIGVGFGWFPLGWGEPFYPRYCGWGHGYWGHPGWGYRGGYVSNAYLRNVNITNTHITNITHITNNYYNNNLANTRYGFRNVAGAVTAAPKSAFTSGAAINKVGTVVPRSELGKGQIVRTADVSPTKESVLGGHAPLTRGIPPATATNRTVATRMTPPGRPASFEANQSSMARGNAASSPERGVTPARMPNTAAANNGGDSAHNVPRPPSAGVASKDRLNPAGNAEAGAARSVPGNSTTQEARTVSPANPAAHPVPRPPERNDNFARGNAEGVNNHAPAVSTQHTPATNSTAHTTPYNPAVPRPPQATQPSRPNTGVQHAAPQQSAPPSHSAPSARPAPSRPAPQSSGMASAPRPPAGYSYRPAPAYSASSRYGSAGAMSSYSGGSSRGSYPSASSYSAGRSYASSPMYSSRSMGSGYQAAPRYSAPRASGGSSRAYSGGGSYRGGGGGSHSSGGGGHHGR